MLVEAIAKDSNEQIKLFSPEINSVDFVLGGKKGESPLFVLLERAKFYKVTYQIDWYCGSDRDIIL